MLPVRTDYVCRLTNRIAYPSQLQMIIFSVDESGKTIVSLEGKSGKTISIGCRFPPKFPNSGTLYRRVYRIRRTVEFLSQWVVRVDGEQFPVRLPLIDHREYAEDFHLDHLTAPTHLQTSHG